MADWAVGPFSGKLYEGKDNKNALSKAHVRCKKIQTRRTCVFIDEYHTKVQNIGLQ